MVGQASRLSIGNDEQDAGPTGIVWAHGDAPSLDPRFHVCSGDQAQHKQLTE
jgi:hypothetical protein